MQTEILCFTGNGANLAGRLVRLLDEAGHTCFWHIKSRYSDAAIREDHPDYDHGLQMVEGTLMSWTQAAFAEYDAIIFIGAAGIAVRAIAPFVIDKYHDPAVLVMDEAGKYVIPILSGHVGGANDLAREIAALTGAEAVLTTASDVQGKFAVDVFAKKNGLRLTNRMKAREIAARIVNGERIPVYIAPKLLLSQEAGPLPDPLELADDVSASKVAIDYRLLPKGHDALHLVPEKMIWLGIGCKKGTPAEAIIQDIYTFLEKYQLHPAAVAGVASIDLKIEEKGIADACAIRKWPFITFSADRLNQVEGSFSFSSFVKKRTGVDCICERAACLASGRDDGGLIVRKQRYEGVTLAAAVTERRLHFDR